MRNDEDTRSVKPVVLGDAGHYQAGVQQRMQEHSFPIGGQMLNCAVGPQNGPSLVLFHGVTRRWQDFTLLLPHLIERWHVFALDHRGHGKSDRSMPSYRVADFAADAASLVEKHVTGPAVLVGHSLGALVAALVAAKLPERVRALVLEDPPGSTLAGGLRQSRFHLQFVNTERLLSRCLDLEDLIDALSSMPVQRPKDGAVVSFGELRDREAIRFGAECLLQMDRAVLKTLVEGRWLEGLDWFCALSGIQCPTLVLRADPAQGGMLDEAEAVRIASLIRHCTRVDLSGLGHSIHSIQPKQMLALFTEFLENHNLLPVKTQP